MMSWHADNLPHGNSSSLNPISYCAPVFFPQIVASCCAQYQPWFLQGFVVSVRVTLIATVWGISWIASGPLASVDHQLPLEVWSGSFYLKSPFLFGWGWAEGTQWWKWENRRGWMWKRRKYVLLSTDKDTSGSCTATKQDGFLSCDWNVFNMTDTILCSRAFPMGLVHTLNLITLTRTKNQTCSCWTSQQRRLSYSRGRFLWETEWNLIFSPQLILLLSLFSVQV